MQLSEEEGNNMTDYIVGTHMDDFIQIYNGRVLIRGPTNMRNIFVPPIMNEDSQQTKESQIIMNNNAFNFFNLHQQYWYKSIDQVQFKF